ncbi:hypothetical protein [Actinacidiphila sp. ITFR-21]|uniref:hypothetical protein n=1 Tax=Actinacidiphila sp. ITFR-21 TaxID=3075199 RepID=UPI00288BBD30|nr:hypothetical protein [Streptomyces sp. ITFR-21]WNI16432.1 hypothetical protein RLT57_13510 [Streptomyces sp. ITFR-21]
MSGFTKSMRSELLDLSDVPLSALRSQRSDVLARTLNLLRRQVEKPWVNVGDDGQPPFVRTD